MNGAIFAGEVATASVISGAVVMGVDASPLLTALITFGVSLVTLAGGELVKYLVALLKKKTDDLKDDEDGKEV